jgi:hypothetical protein
VPKRRSWVPIVVLSVLLALLGTAPAVASGGGGGSGGGSGGGGGGGGSNPPPATPPATPPPASAAVAFVNILQPRVTGGDVVEIAPNLTAIAPAGGLRVGLSSSNPAVLAVPVSVTVPAGAFSGQVSATARPVTAATVVTVTATLAGQAVTGTVEVDPTRVPTSLQFSQNPAPDTATEFGSVFVSTPADAAFPVAVTSSNPAVAAVPAQVTVFPDDGAGNFNVTLGQVGAPANVTITATANGVTVSAVLTVVPAPPPPFTLTELDTSAPKVAGAGSVTATVHGNEAAPAGGITVKLSVSDSRLASVPATVVIPAGASSASFPVTTTGKGTAVVAIGAVYQDTGPAAALGVTPSGGGTLPPVLGGPQFQQIPPSQVNNEKNALNAGVIGVGTSANVESGALPPGLGITFIQHLTFVFPGALTTPGTYTFVLRFTGPGADKNGDVVPYVWVITP